MGFSIQQLYRRNVLLLCGALMLLVTFCLTVASLVETRFSAIHELQSQANMIALQLVNEQDVSTQELTAILKTASVNRSLELACVVSDKSVTRASTPGPRFTEANPVTCSLPAPGQFDANRLLVHSSISDPALPKPTGQVILIARTPSIEAFIAAWIAFALLIGSIFGGICWVLGLRFERVLLKPIRQIASTAQRVSLYKDYSLRVVAGALAVVPKEIEGLTDSFNTMLHEIEDRDTRLTRKGEELEKSRHAAVAASLAKSQFLANVSHELRTPLNAIIGFSTMIGDEQFGPLGNAKYKEYARDIHDSGRHLLDVINDILDLSKAETGTLSITFESLNLAKIVEKAINIVAGHAHERRIDVFIDMPPKLPKIYADRVRLVQILLNLLSNAIKFTGEGGKVIVRAKAEAAKNNVHYFVIEVQDNGIGMAEADINKAFVKFNQADAGLNRKYEGAGLGLPLTKRLVELHHGKIRIDSVVGQGTTVTVRLTSDPALLD